MIALGIKFLNGRFHATPWGRHVNEAAPEWPPSPWRILRALIATWRRRLRDAPVCTRDAMESLLRCLATAPVFVLPQASTGHSRHYMPLYEHEDKTLVFDAWVALEKDDELVVLWPDAEVSETGRQGLQALASNLGYLGRAESWTQARVLSDVEAAEADARVNCKPSDLRHEAKGQDSVRVLCLDPASAFGNEHTPKRSTQEGKGKARRTVLHPLYDPDWHLCMETLCLHQGCWSDPPGARWVTYHRPSNCFAVKPGRPARQRERARVTIARFALDSAVLPMVADTLPIAERARITAMGCFRRAAEESDRGATPTSGESVLPRSEVFSGKDGDGQPLAGHLHAYYLPTDEDGDGRIDHLTIVAEMGFGPTELKALDRLRQLKRDKGDPVQTILMALGQREGVLAPELLGPSTVWISATPFLASRHPKSNGRKRDPAELLGPENARAFALQVLSEEIMRLRERRPDIPEPVAVAPLCDDHRCGAHSLRPIQFKRFRQKRGDDGGRRAAGAFRIEFPTQVRGPICLGHSSHFGLGLFVPA